MGYVSELYEEYVEKYADPRVDDLPFMDTPNLAIYAIIFYLVFVKIVGPWYMKARDPLQLNKLIVGYNVFQTIFNLVLLMLGLYYVGNINYSVICQENDTTKTDYYTLQTIKICWVFTLSRFLEFADTIFFVLRKEDNQITSLHLMHHVLVPLIFWLGMKVEPTGHFIFVGILNTFVNIFIYFSYIIEAYKKYVGLQKYAIILQLAQFALVSGHAFWGLYSECHVNKLFAYLILFQGIFFYKLFYDYYVESFATSNDGSIFDTQKFYSKYKTFFEMCIPDQTALMRDDDNENGNSENDE